jgi:hypothetical protein
VPPTKSQAFVAGYSSGAFAAAGPASAEPAGPAAAAFLAVAAAADAAAAERRRPESGPGLGDSCRPGPKEQTATTGFPELDAQPHEFLWPWDSATGSHGQHTHRSVALAIIHAIINKRLRQSPWTHFLLYGC